MFLFDQSTNHKSFEENALVASRLNLKPGGKQPQIRDGWHIKDGKTVIQAMQNDEGVPKGIKQILIERNLWPHNDILLECKNGKCQGESCCAMAILKSQQNKLKETIESKGHLCDFLPKFHCELNAIERWGFSKRIIGEEGPFKINELEKMIDEILDDVPISTIKKYFLKTWRFIEAYEKGVTGPVAEWAVKKYKKHRVLPSEFVDIYLKENTLDSTLSCYSFNPSSRLDSSQSTEYSCFELKRKLQEAPVYLINKVIFA